MRVFVCASCGKNIEVGWCTNQRGRDLQCPDCGGRVYREHAERSRMGKRRTGMGNLTAVADNMSKTAQAGGAPGSRKCGVPASGSGRGRGGRGFGGRRSG